MSKCVTESGISHKGLRNARESFPRVISKFLHVHVHLHIDVLSVLTFWTSNVKAST